MYLPSLSTTFCRLTEDFFIPFIPKNSRCDAKKLTTSRSHTGKTTL